jgi:4-amino-4-deoxy-L-arabinose transferase-like glycosyltransferase
MTVDSVASPVRPRRRLPPRLWIALLAAVLALGFLGLRGIWDPDEGRYTNVAMNMLDSGDWLTPRRSDDVGHWTKPPLTYWAIAGSVAAFGRDPWAARLPSALAFLLCTWLAWRIGRRLAPGSEDPAALAFATMALPFGASQYITTDFLLAACETLAVWAFVESRFDASSRTRRWLLAMWAAFALAFLTKGPPALLPLLAMTAFDLSLPRGQRRRLFDIGGLAVFVAIAAPWFVAVMRANPGLSGYFIGNEVVNRVATDEFGRFGAWYGWLQVYAPTLLLGTLPWTPALLRWARRLPADARGWWRNPQRRAEQQAWLFPTLWLLLPLLVFCVSRSRLPLYLLPLFPALAVLAAMQRQREGRGLPGWRAVAAWAALLLALALGSARWPTHKDADAWAGAIRERVPGRIDEVRFVEDMARYGLHLELGAQVEKLSLLPDPRAARFNPVDDTDVAHALADTDAQALWITKQQTWPRVRARFAALGYRTLVQGTPYQGRMLFRVVPANGG